MCGIAGFCNKEIDQKTVILQMNQQMYYRGPDAGGFFLDEGTGVTLGHRRLSIQDISPLGAQPMYSADQRYVLVYNGEIYNADILRKSLLEEHRVTEFKGSSDTEVLLEACVAYGLKNTLERCKGMFALALYDRKTKTLQLARDRVGEKPLYYGIVNHHFAFASDLSALKQIPGFHNPISQEALGMYLRYGFIKAPYSIYQDIYKVLPGTILTIEYPYEKAKKESYWSLEEVATNGRKNPFWGTYEEAVKELERLLKTAVNSQMIADVPLGAYLSGGIDSTVIVSLMQSISEKKIRTFTIGFEDAQYNEADFAKETADYLGTEHREMYVTEEELKNVIPKLASVYTEPFADKSQIPTYLLSKLTKEHVTVALSGDAGDELFCGYNTYDKVGRLWNQISKVPYGIRKQAGKILLCTPFAQKDKFYRIGHCLQAEHIAGLQEAVCYDTTELYNQLIKIPYQKTDYCFWENDINDMMLQDLMEYHPDDILVKVDRAGMAVSLENRVPMLDKDVVEFALSLPLSFKYENGVSKRILKDVLYSYVPKERMERPKKGFSVPLQKWMSNGIVREWAEDMIMCSTLAKDDILDKETMQKAWTRFLETGQNKSLVYYLAILEQWYREW
ncbi:MAG: asparagine synthase (glutamine-hydrolyzing) [Lachnospiraceae bacterium]|nr:asparagine synthase (glutamine-hydrolyzing) [Lachnospiraceae bacterium]